MMSAFQERRQIWIFGASSKLTRLLLLFVGLITPRALTAGTQPILPVSVLTYHNDIARTGENTNEAILTPANVGSTNFIKLFSHNVDWYVFAEPLVEANVKFTNGTIHNVVFIATENNSVYAFDADNNSGANANPLWHVSFTNLSAALQVTAVPAGDTGSSEIAGKIGITSTPVIDPVSGTIYVEAKTKEVVPSTLTTNYVHRLHALDVTTGAEKFGGPVVISATVPGTGDGSSGGTLAFDGLRHLNRPGLLLLNGVVYIAFASLGDKAPYHGWFLGYDAHSLAQSYVYNADPNGSDGGIWESGCGPAADTNGYVFVSTGNGTYDGTTNNDYGDSLLKLYPTNGTVGLVDYFTPQDQDALNSADKDFGSGGITLLPDEAGSIAHPHLLVTAGKQGTIYLVDRDNLTGFNTPTDLIVQEMPSNILKSWGSPAYFNHTVYYVGSGDVPEAFSMSNGVIGSTVVSNTTVYTSTGASPTISANGTSNAIMWTVGIGDHLLHSYVATNIATEIGTGQSLGTTVKFSVATIANGKVYVGTTNTVQVFGLGTPSITSEPQSVQAIPGTNATFSVTASSAAPPLSYQWFKDNTALLNQTNATLTVSNAQITDGGAYSVVVSDQAGRALSVIADLDITGIKYNSDGTATVAFPGTPGQSYHIQGATNLTPATNWQDLPGSGTSAPPGGVWQFTDSNAPSFPVQFYRSVSP